MKPIKIIILFMALIISGRIYAEDMDGAPALKEQDRIIEKSDNKDTKPPVRFDLETGVKGDLVSDTGPVYVYAYPFLKSGFTTKYFAMYAGYSRYINYQLTDGVSYEYIGFNEILTGAKVTPLEFIEVSFDFEYHTGDTAGRYERYAYNFGIDFDFEKFSISAYADFGNTGYLFAGTQSVTSRNYDITGEAAYYYSDDVSFILSYTHNNFTSDLPLSYIYTKNTFNLGVMALLVEKTFLSGGLDAGFDSNSYGLAGFNIGVNSLVWNHLKLYIHYTFLYNISPTDVSTTRRASALSSVSSSYLSQRLIFGASFKL